jgi:3',5'-cyclic AMP phosphodiesterase CpdA
MIAVIGDTQRTLLLERLLGREQNDPDRSRLVQEIARLKPELLVHLGDLVANGARQDNWASFDRLVAPLHDAHIPILPVLGNHDRWGNDGRAMRHFRSRFPWFPQCGWYTRRHGPLRLVWLDSNRDRMTEQNWLEQARWFQQTLADADLDGGTAGVVVFAHHPPYTNSRRTGDAIEVQQAFVDAFSASRKTLAFIAGHTHAYERFVKRNKTYIVSGGGGGPRARLRHGSSARHVDAFDGPSPRPFHFLTLLQVRKGLQVEARGMDKAEERTRPFDRFILATPLTGQPAASD